MCILKLNDFYLFVRLFGVDWGTGKSYRLEIGMRVEYSNFYAKSPPLSEKR